MVEGWWWRGKVGLAGTEHRPGLLFLADDVGLDELGCC